MVPQPRNYFWGKNSGHVARHACINASKPSGWVSIQTACGAGWTHEREGGGSFITVQLDCPTFARPLRASLVRTPTQDEVHVLVWARQKRRQRED